MGLFKELKAMSERSKQRKAERKNKENRVNKNPTEEQLKNNKKGKLAYLWIFLSVVAYVGGFAAVAAGFEENVAVGIIALLFVLAVTPMVQRKAIVLAQDQRQINGKGLPALILAYILPTAILAFGFFFFVFGYYHMTR